MLPAGICRINRSVDTAAARATYAAGRSCREGDPVPFHALRPGLAAFTAIAGIALLAGCSRHGGAGGAGPAAQSAAPRATSTLAIAGRQLDGADQATIRAYLQTVREIKPKRFAVRWSADTVAVSREAAMRSLQSINEDGSLYTFASSEPVVKRLQPGSIMWIWDIAIRRVDSVVQLDDVTLVHAKPVALTEALTQADIEFESPVDFASAYGALRPHLPKQAPPQKTSRLDAASPFRRVTLGPEEPDAPPSPPPDSANGTPDDEDDYGLVAATQDGYTGRLKGFEYSLGYKVFPSHVSFEIEARKEEEGDGRGEGNEIHRDQRDEFFELVNDEREAKHRASEDYDEMASLTVELHKAQNARNSAMGKSQNAQEMSEAIEKYKEERQEAIEKYKEAKAEGLKDEAKIHSLVKAGSLAKEVFYIASDNLDVRFKAEADLERATLEEKIQIDQSALSPTGNLSAFATRFKNMSGRMDLEFVGRLGQPGNGAVGVPVMHVPVVMNIPMPAYGIPFVAQAAADFLLKVFLSGNHATQHLSGHFTFGGGGGLDATAKQTHADSDLSGSKPEIDAETAESPGTSGAVVAVQIPRVGIGIGFIGASTMAYVDQISVVTMTNSAGVATLNPACTRDTWDATFHVGIETSVMPIPIPLVQTVASQALSQAIEVGHVQPWKHVDPDIPMCHLHHE